MNVSWKSCLVTPRIWRMGIVMFLNICVCSCGARDHSFWSLVLSLREVKGRSLILSWAGEVGLGGGGGTAVGYPSPPHQKWQEQGNPSAPADRNRSGMPFSPQTGPGQGHPLLPSLLQTGTAQGTLPWTRPGQGHPFSFQTRHPMDSMYDGVNGSPLAVTHEDFLVFPSDLFSDGKSLRKKKQMWWVHVRSWSEITQITISLRTFCILPSILRISPIKEHRCNHVKRRIPPSKRHRRCRKNRKTSTLHYHRS